MRDLLFDLLLATIFIPALVLTFWQGNSRFHDLEGEIVERLREESSQSAGQIGAWLSARRGDLEEVAQLAAQQPEQANWALERLRRDGAFAAVVLSGADGSAALPDDLAADLRRAAAAHPAEPEFTPIFRTGNGEPIIGWVVPRPDGAGHLYAALRQQALCMRLRGLTHAQRMDAVLLDARRVVIACNQPEMTLLLTDYDEHHAGWDLHHHPGAGDDVQHWTPRRNSSPAIVHWHQSSYVREQPLGHGIPWTLVAEYPAAQFHDQVQWLYLSGFLVCLASAVFAVAVAGVGSRGIVRQLRQVAAATADLPERVGSQQPLELPDSGIGEIAELVGNFRRTAARLRESFAEVRELNATLERRVERRTRALAEEVAERRRAEERLRLASQIVDSTAEGVLVTDPEGTIEFVNPAFTLITGYGAQEAVGKTPALLRSDRHDADFYRAMWEAIALGGHWEGQVWNRRKDGSLYPQWLDISAIRAPSGELLHYAGIFTDITEQEEAKRRLDHLAYYDELTGLPNRRLLRDRMEQAMAAARRHGTLLALLFIDLDRFKVVNDTLGHGVGDRLLQAAAERLRASTRDSDTAARLGGDEFVVLATDMADSDAIAALAQKLVALFEECFRIDGRDLFITPSIGISVFPEDAGDGERLLRNADIAMYRAKERSRNTYRFYAAAMNTRTEERLALENTLRLALQREELVLHYQPQVELRSGRLVGMEALVRWHHPERGMVPPGDFIPIAEESGLIIPIGAYIVRAACRQLRLWREAGLEPVRLAVNLSPKQFIGTDLKGTVADAAATEGIDPALLELELTESLFLDDTLAVDQLLHGLKELGATLAIDDFGTGYSSLSYLKHFPMDALKIDRSFVNDIISDPEDAAIVAAVVTMARTLGLRVVAEGVETAEQLHFLRKQGCDEVQGFYLARPAPAETAADWLRNRDDLLPAEALPDPRDIPTVLVIDGDSRVAHSLQRMLHRDGYRVLTAGDEVEAFTQLSRHAVHVVVSEQRLERGDGAALLEKVRRLYPGTARILLTGYTDLHTLTEAVNRGHIYRFLTKPWEDEELRAAVRSAFEESGRGTPTMRTARK